MSHESGRIVFATSVCTRACDCTSAEDMWAHPPPRPTNTHHPFKVPVLLSPENGLFRLQGPVLELATGILAFHQRVLVKRQLCVCESQSKVALCISCVMLRYMFRQLPLRPTHHCVNEVIQALGKFFLTLFTKSPRVSFWPRGKNFHWFLKDISGLTL